MRTRRGTHFLGVLVCALLFDLAAPVDAGAAWLLHPQISQDAPRIGTHAWDVDQQRMEAVWDLIHIYRHTLGLPGSLQALQNRMQTTSQALQGLGARTTVDDPAEAELLAMTILRHRALEEMCLRLGLDHDGLEHAAAADSLSEQLRLLLEPLPATPATALALAAGVRASRAQWDRLHPALYGLWREILFAPEESIDGSMEFLLFHVLALRDGRVLDDVDARAPRNTAVSTLQEFVRQNRQGRLAVFRSDDTARRLLLAVHQLVHDTRVGRTALGIADRLAWMDVDPSTPYPTALATLDSLQGMLDAARPAVAWRASAQSLQRTRDLDLEMARGAVRHLRHRFGARVLTAQGMHWSADLDPDELVPGQQIATWWHLQSTRAQTIHAWRGTLLDQVVSFRSAPEVIAPDTTIQMRSSFTTLESGVAGTSLLLQPTLNFSLEGVGEIELCEPLAARIVAPIQASLDILGGAVIGRDAKTVAITVTSRTPAILQGTFEVLRSADWTVSPATAFAYELRRPGQTVRQTLEIELPAWASPGPYALKVRLTTDGRNQGTLRTTLVRPVEWVVIGPFAPPAAGAQLPPENGINFDRWVRGADGKSVSWQLVSPAAYDVDGALDFDALFEDRRANRCACAMTVLEAMDTETVRLDVEGAERLIWNGIRKREGEPLALQTGRNTLLLRSCSNGRTWRLRLRLTGESGDVIRTVDNDLSRLLEGFESIRTAPQATPEDAQRLVTVQFTGPEAREVAVLGSFNAWVPLELDKSGNGTWRRDLLLAPGRYPYKLLVDGQLKPDPKAERFEPDGFGGRNSLLIVK